MFDVYVELEICAGNTGSQPQTDPLFPKIIDKIAKQLEKKTIEQNAYPY
jgi:hypothetical protein